MLQRHSKSMRKRFLVILLLKKNLPFTIHKKDFRLNSQCKRFLAIGLPHEIAHGSLRLTLSAETTMEQIDFTVDCLKKIVERLRSMSPLYEDYIKKHPQQ